MDRLSSDVANQARHGNTTPAPKKNGDGDLDQRVQELVKKAQSNLAETRQDYSAFTPESADFAEKPPTRSLHSRCQLPIGQPLQGEEVNFAGSKFFSSGAAPRGLPGFPASAGTN